MKKIFFIVIILLLLNLYCISNEKSHHNFLISWQIGASGGSYTISPAVGLSVGTLSFFFDEISSELEFFYNIILSEPGSDLFREDALRFNLNFVVRYLISKKDSKKQWDLKFGFGLIGISSPIIKMYRQRTERKWARPEINPDVILGARRIFYNKDKSSGIFLDGSILLNFEKFANPYWRITIGYLHNL